MRVLVVAQAINPDRTSEGICSFKFVKMLADLDLHIDCLVGEDASNLGDQYSIKNVEMVSVAKALHKDDRSGWEWLLNKRADVFGMPVSQKIGAALAYASGYGADQTHRMHLWKKAIARVIKRVDPDVVVVRGAGGSFEPHIAFMNLETHLPWIAHYHDPYPASLYPAPYRHHVRFVSDWQERMHRKIIARSSAISFPSHRLRDWVLQGELEVYRNKAHIVPHISDFLFDRFSILENDGKVESDFSLVHTGSLLGPRDPKALIDGFLRFVGSDGERRHQSKLVLIGAVNTKHASTIDRATRTGLVEVVRERQTYRMSLERALRATAVVVLEASSQLSPFFPAKLADYASLGKPVLALSPKASVVSDMLGSCYPLLVDPSDEEAVARAIELLWMRWKAGESRTLVPSSTMLLSCSPSHVGQLTHDMLVSVTRDARIRQQ